MNTDTLIYILAGAGVGFFASNVTSIIAQRIRDNKVRKRRVMYVMPSLITGASQGNKPTVKLVQSCLPPSYFKSTLPPSLEGHLPEELRSHTPSK